MPSPVGSQPRVASAVDLPHPAFACELLDHVRPELLAA